MSGYEVPLASKYYRLLLRRFDLVKQGKNIPDVSVLGPSSIPQAIGDCYLEVQGTHNLVVTLIISQ